MTPETMLLADGSEITVLHLLFQPPFGHLRIACMPGLRDFASNKNRAAPILRTDEVRSVNCPLCKASEDYRVMKEAALNAKLEWKR